MAVTESVVGPLEQLALSIIKDSHRVVGFSTPSQDPRIASLSQAVGCLFARSGYKTLVIDLAQPVRASDREGWHPGRGDVNRFISRHENDFDHLLAHPTPDTRFAFNNVKGTRAALDGDLATYERVLIGLGSLHQPGPNIINSVAVAAACDAVYVVCKRGITTAEQLSGAVQAARAAGANVAGVIVDETHHVRLSEQMNAASNRVLHMLPRAVKRLFVRTVGGAHRA